jgi:predicted ester cyclase
LCLVEAWKTRHGMSATENKTIIRRLVEELWNRGNLAIIDELFESQGVHTIGDDHQRSLEEIKETVREYRSAFPDLQITIAQLLAEGDEVMVRFTVDGTHQGTFTGIAPSEVGVPVGVLHGRSLTGSRPDGHRVTFQIIATYRLLNAKIISSWVLMDDIGMLRQLGVIPVVGARGHA